MNPTGRRALPIATCLAALLAAGCAGAEPSAAAAAGAGGAPLDPVLARSWRAAGGPRWDRVSSLRLDGALEAGGLRGEVSSVEELTSGRSVSRHTLGPVRGAAGNDGATSWSQAPGGEVMRGDGPGERISAATAAWMTARAYWYPSRRPGRVERAPDRVEGGRRFQVVRATPAGGRPIELWFDGATGLLARHIEVNGAVTTTTRLSDYREVDGLRLPFEIRSGTGEARYDVIVRVAGYRLNPAVATADFAPPAPRTGDVAFAGGAHRTTLPFELINNHIYVSAEIDGRPIRLLVDTGGANILTPAVAARLGLASEGALEGRGAGAGTTDVGLARAGALRLGEATIARPVFYTMDLGPLSSVEGVELAGLVGYEIFHRFVVRVDYADRRLTLIDPRRYDPGEQTGEVLPFTRDGHMPVVAATLDGIPGQFTVDTGSRSSLTLHAGFTASNDLVARYRAGRARVTGWGVGGPVLSAPVRTGELALGSLRVRGAAADLFTGAEGAFADRDHAGNIGSGLLRRFTVTFDYGRSRMILEPNRDFAAPDPYDRSGMWMNARGPNRFEIVDVVAGGPAAAAGLMVGDLVVSIGGRAARSDDLPRARQRLREGAAGSRVAVVHERKGARRTASMVLADTIRAP